MKLYQVTAAEYDYDEYDAFVIWAEGPEEALAIAQGFAVNFDTGATVCEVEKPEQSGVLLSSFNAG